jgi:hypothetical protein
MNESLKHDNTVDHAAQFLLFPNALVSCCSCSCTSLHKMADKRRLYLEQCIKTVLFCIETRSVVVTQRQFDARFQTRWAPSFRTIHKLYNRFNNDGSVLERKHLRPSSVHSWENIDAFRVLL